MNTQLLMDTARAMVADDKGLLAMDESHPTCNRRFAKLAIPQTEEARRAYRQLFITVPGLAFLSGGPSAEPAPARLNALPIRFKSRASRGGGVVASPRHSATESWGKHPMASARHSAYCFE